MLADAPLLPRTDEPDILGVRTVRGEGAEQVRVIPASREAVGESPVLVVAGVLLPIAHMLA